MKRRLIRILMTVVSIGLFAFLHDHAIIPLSVEHVRISYAYPFRDVISVVLGPLAGGLVGSVGMLLSSEDFSLGSILMIVLNGLDGVLIGLLCRKIDVKNGFFGKNDLLTFLKSFTFSHFLCFVVIRSVVLFIYGHNQGMAAASYMPGVLSAGLWMFLIDAVLSLDVATLLLVVFAKTRVSEANFYRS